MMTTRLLTKRQVADILGVSVRTVDRLRSDGELKTIRVRHGVRFALASVELYLARAGGNRP